MPQDAPNPKGIMSSKASGEPALMAASSVIMAFQQAAAAAAHDIAAATANNCKHTPEAPRALGGLGTAITPHDDAAAAGGSGAAAAGGGGGNPVAAGGGGAGGDNPAAAAAGGSDVFVVLPAPATPQHIKAVVGRFSVAELLQKAMEGGGAQDDRITAAKGAKNAAAGGAVLAAGGVRGTGVHGGRGAVDEAEWVVV